MSELLKGECLNCHSEDVEVDPSCDFYCKYCANFISPQEAHSRNLSSAMNVMEKSLDDKLKKIFDRVDLAERSVIQEIRSV